MNPPRLLVDECCPLTVVRALRDVGFDVRYVAEESPGLTDADVLASAAREDRIVVTSDNDFGTLVVRLGHPVAGMILLRVARLSSEAAARRAARVLADNADRLAGRMTTLTENWIRRRTL